MEHKIINIDGWGKCAVISNSSAEITVTLDLGPRIIGYALKDGQNFMNPIGKTDPIETEWGTFYTYGGHRFWHAPEVSPRSYVPDNDPITYDLTETGGIFYYNYEKLTGIDKKIEIRMNETDSSCEVIHTLTNRNVWDIKAAPWALSIVAPGGKLIIPQEPFIPHTDCLVPARPLVLWNYTDMADTRYTWGERYIEVRNDRNINTPQKIGVLDKEGWAGYYLNGQLFLKEFDFDENGNYPDYQCNLETFTNGEFHEFETVAPITELKASGGEAVYTEKWKILDCCPENSEEITDFVKKNL